MAPHADATFPCGGSVAGRKKSCVGNWGIENGLHWILDAVFGEDRARMRQDNAAEHFSVLRRIALDLFLREKSVKAGIKNRRQ